ncbi:MAG: DUF5777 family beta-barrel protein [Acidobacteriota bacterium]
MRPFNVTRAFTRLPFVAAAFLMSVCTAVAQTPPAAPDPIPTAAPLPTEIDLNLINLPTTMSLGSHKGYFRLTHRFARDLRRGSVGSLASDLFSLDNGAIIGLEYRYAITGNLHAGINRSMSNKTIQTFARWDAVRQGEARPVSLSVTGSFEGLNNLHERYQPGIAVTVSRTFGDSLALYATPGFVAKTRKGDPASAGIAGDEQDTTFVGLGARVRFNRSGYLVAEYTPRVAGYDPNKSEWGIAIEKRTGGHTLQLNFTNSFGTTLGQLAQGGSLHDVYLGFNVTRRF